tara:strand:+ start:1734 stop:1964 length:231 start_codon:yes stop_codon:yes gene_type:complete
MNKHELVAGASDVLARVMGDDSRPNRRKLEIILFLGASLQRAADSLELEDSDLHLPLADLFGRLARAEEALLENEA